MEQITQKYIQLCNDSTDISAKLEGFFRFVSSHNKITEKYKQLCNTPSDINEHLPTISRYASLCKSVFETGIRGVVSSYALIHGLMSSNNLNTKILLNDINECDIKELLEKTKDLNISVDYIWKNNLEIDFNGKTFDLTFIDTWHVYGQLKRELAKFSQITNKYIILHDTTVDEWYGETMRCGCDAVKQSAETGIPVAEINRGIWPAIENFLRDNPSWKVKERFVNNNGLTILERQGKTIFQQYLDMLEKQEKTILQRYLDILKRSILDIIYDPTPLVSNEVVEEGKYHPERGHSMIGLKRMNNIQECFENIVRCNIPGDLIETGVWRGGATIFMAGLNKVYGQNRKIYVADSFEGLQKPDPRYPADAGDIHHTYKHLAVSLEDVRRNFERYDLLDENIVFVKGFFENSLKTVDIKKLALLRLDGDMYCSTIQVLELLYDKVVSGGYIIIDDYTAVYGCRKAVEDFRRARNITEPIIHIDYSGRYWRKQ